MTRPPAGPPPVAPSAVARRTDRKEIANYQQLVHELRREDRRADLRALLGSDEMVERFIAVALHALATNQDLLRDADPISIVLAVKDAAALGLEPTGLAGEGWIICYGDQAVFQPGYRGYLKRIRNSRLVQDVDCQLVYDKDEFSYGWTEKGGWFQHNPAKLQIDHATQDVLVERGSYWGAYAYAVMSSGFVELEVMAFPDIEEIRTKFSPSERKGRPGPWKTSWGEMARKTLIRRLSKRLPQAAVDALLIQDAKADAAADEQGDSQVMALDIGRVRARALAATGRPVSGTGVGDVQGTSTEPTEAAAPDGAPPAIVAVAAETEEEPPFPDRVPQ